MANAQYNMPQDIWQFLKEHAQRASDETGKKVSMNTILRQRLGIPERKADEAEQRQVSA